jgi:hypothetical protein
MEQRKSLPLATREAILLRLQTMNDQSILEYVEGLSAIGTGSITHIQARRIIDEAMGDNGLSDFLMEMRHERSYSHMLPHSDRTGGNGGQDVPLI